MNWGKSNKDSVRDINKAVGCPAKKSFVEGPRLSFDIVGKLCSETQQRG